jgi:hypothetical protein
MLILFAFLGYDIIESQEKQGAWVAELVDARDLKNSLSHNK